MPLAMPLAMPPPIWATYFAFFSYILQESACAIGASPSSLEGNKIPERECPDRPYPLQLPNSAVRSVDIRRQSLLPCQPLLPRRAADIIVILYVGAVNCLSGPHSEGKCATTPSARRGGEVATHRHLSQTFYLIRLGSPHGQRDPIQVTNDLLSATRISTDVRSVSMSWGRTFTVPLQTRIDAAQTGRRSRDYVRDSVSTCHPLSCVPRSRQCMHSCIHKRSLV